MFKIGDIVTPDFDDGRTNNDLVKGDYYKVIDVEHNPGGYKGDHGCRVTHIKSGRELGWFTSEWFKISNEYKVKRLLKALNV